MKIKFYKYQGAGNDFIMIDNRDSLFMRDTALIEKLCNRYFGIGADGLILLENDDEVDFKMIYFNSDGNESTMCGNGGRCIAKFAHDLSVVSDKMTFKAIDGLHLASVNNNLINLQMIDVNEIQINNASVFLNTGSPHHIEYVDNLDNIDVYNLGKKIRYGAPYFEEGTNVNFVEILSDDKLKIRTYERGVENETLACGTGITAAAIATYRLNKIKTNLIEVQAKGGNLFVNFDEENDHITNVWLKGPAEFVFKGEIDL